MVCLRCVAALTLLWALLAAEKWRRLNEGRWFIDGVR